MDSDPKAILSALDRCSTNTTDELQCFEEVAENVTSSLQRMKTRHWLDKASWITCVSFSLLLDSISCFVGIVCTCVALAVLCQRTKSQRKLSSALFLQRTLVVTDLCCVLIHISRVISSGYRYHVYEYSSRLDRYNQYFAWHVSVSLETGFGTASVWLAAIIAIDR